ncbi:hypothetical protein [Myceligenerans halotolerans]
MNVSIVLAALILAAVTFVVGYLLGQRQKPQTPHPASPSDASTSTLGEDEDDGELDGEEGQKRPEGLYGYND